MKWHPGESVDWRQVIFKLPLVLMVAFFQIIATYLIWQHLDATLAIVLTPAGAWWLYFRIVRMPWPKGSSIIPAHPRWIASILAFLFWWAACVIAVNAFGK
jgi:hypothetical protein